MCQFIFNGDQRTVVRIQRWNLTAWYHLSKGHNNWILRRKPTPIVCQPLLADLPPDCVILAEIGHEVVQQRTNQDVNVSVVNNPEHWDQVLGMLDAQEANGGAPPLDGGGPIPPPPPEPPVEPAEAPKVIPATEMLHLYSVLEDFNSTAFHLGMAHETERAPVLRKLAQRFRTSVRQFGSYNNADQEFHTNQGDPGDFDHSVVRPQDIPKTKDLTRRLFRQDGCTGSVVNDPSLNFRLVDWEVPPARTTNGAVHADGRPFRRAKTLDWLLANATDNRLVIGEIKIRNDRDPFYALIQSLMYTAELVTDFQIQRLNNHYPQQFEFSEDPDLGCRLAPKADIYVILCGYNWASPTRQEIFDSFQRICETLVQEPVLADYVRRIACLDVRFSSNRDLQFFKLFSYPEVADE